MTHQPNTHHRRSLRLQGFDYSQPGAYFVTFVTQDRLCLFGAIENDMMVLNDVGEMVQALWEELPRHNPEIMLDEFVIMPNHLHAILVIAKDPVGAGLVGTGLVPAPDSATTLGAATSRAATSKATTRVAPTVLGNVVGAFKSRVTVEYIRGVKTNGWPPFRGRVWQRNYYEHIIRNDDSLARIREYIVNNPLQWALDQENPANVAAKGER